MLTACIHQNKKIKNKRIKMGNIGRFLSPIKLEKKIVKFIDQHDNI